MRHEKNRAVLGALFVIIGVYMLINFGGLNLGVLGYLPWLTFGAVLLLLYYCKRKTWALFLGVIMVWLSAYAAQKELSVNWLWLPCVLFFFIPGTIFMALFLTKNKQGLLIPASFLLWTGIGITIKSLRLFPPKVSILTLCLGMAFMTVYLLGNTRVSRNYLYIGGIIYLFGMYSLIKPLSLVSLDKIGWLAVAILCVILILKARRKRNDDSARDGDELDG